MPVYKDDKRGTWYCKIRYTDWQGNRKETTRRGFATKREAKEYEAEYLNKMAGSADMTLQSLFDIYIEKPHDLLDLLRRSLPVFSRKSIGRDSIYTPVTAKGDNAFENAASNAVSRFAGKALGSCPSSVAVHNKGDVLYTCICNHLRHIGGGGQIGFFLIKDHKSFLSWHFVVAKRKKENRVQILLQKEKDKRCRRGDLWSP